MNIGEVSKLLNVKTSLIRYYEEKNIVVPSSRNKNNYRNYSNNDVKKLRWVLWCKSCGLSLADIINVSLYEQEENYEKIIDLLQQNKKNLSIQMSQIKENIELIDKKIEKYNQIKEK